MPKVKTSKEEILGKALYVFRKQGYFHTSMDKLAKACDIKKPHFYYYFKNKEELMGAVLEVVYQYTKRKVIDTAYDESLSLEERFNAIGRRLFRQFSQGQGGCIMGNTALEVAPLDKSPRYLEIVKKFFEEMIEALTYLYLKKLPQEKAHEEAERSIQDIEGGVMLMQVYEDPDYLKRALLRTARVLLPDYQGWES